jgi:hypothetical protein
LKHINPSTANCQIENFKARIGIYKNLIRIVTKPLDWAKYNQTIAKAALEVGHKISETNCEKSDFIVEILPWKNWSEKA